ncbi:HTH-type transcriptional regulator, transcriptional repressor of NAD biosynthesis genes [Chitinophaga skermanii]|uniref:HTH-type transcriptional regulator, transcriptional repressor of NAD biosynthesis genes n=1 Tax=Chitinophaga skermanii TaxID=331697 RepID=A0A327R3X7_9BACT|nr:AAA family ATPase [Chitinophaga skermanii]RAJ10915.1 HTH-type transcriptional regulator, transcriptional repressor of NAD biosynthesis genes [Chitinophaga skermanii]
MKKGLVLGKFYPLHTGHLALINHALWLCDELYILICASNKETIPGAIRLQWIKDSFPNQPFIKPILFEYNEADLPNTSVSDEGVSKVWSEVIATLVPPIDVFVASEPYAVFVAAHLHCAYELFDVPREQYPIAASDIRKQPLQHWGFIAPVARSYFTKKICLYGTESTGKSTLTQLLAEHYQTAYVPEMAREVIEHTDEVQPAHLQEIATLHAYTIVEKLPTAHKLLFIDTDVNITRSYSEFLFQQPLQVAHWITAANKMDLYLFLENDAPYIQDGTRLDRERRDALHLFHEQQLLASQVPFVRISGTWDERLQQAITAVDAFLSTQ